jgi:hypothetical protein
MTTISPPAASTGRGRKKLLYVLGAIVVVVIAVVGLGAVGVIPLFSHSNSAKVTVSNVTLSFTPTPNPCFLQYTNQTPVSLSAGGIETVSVNLSTYGSGLARLCTVTAIQASTPGFSIVSPNTPLLVPISGSSKLTFGVQYPSSAYDGPLNLSATTSYISPNVTVTSVNLSWSPTTNPCGVDRPVALWSSLTYFGGATPSDSIGYGTVNPSKACTLSAISTSTPGFAIVNASVPQPTPDNGITTVDFAVLFPEEPYDGGLNITLTLTW